MTSELVLILTLNWKQFYHILCGFANRQRPESINCFYMMNCFFMIHNPWPILFKLNFVIVIQAFTFLKFRNYLKEQSHLYRIQNFSNKREMPVNWQLKRICSHAVRTWNNFMRALHTRLKRSFMHKKKMCVLHFRSILEAIIQVQWQRCIKTVTYS